ncbi:MAG: hypothetical protein P1U90_05130 [Akkermansiaceae bacterium]|nr:hypothetical protein [Akkermansiaceae bacterium]
MFKFAHRRASAEHAQGAKQGLYRTTELIDQAEEAALSQAARLTLIVSKFVVATLVIHIGRELRNHQSPRLRWS